MNYSNKFDSAALGLSVKTAVISLLAATVLSACSDKDNGRDIALSEVPANVISIVQNTLPGIALSEAEKEIKNNTVIYELEGKLFNGEEYEIEITESGLIIKIELED